MAATKPQHKPHKPADRNAEALLADEEAEKEAEQRAKERKAKKKKKGRGETWLSPLLLAYDREANPRSRSRARSTL